ncbi:hypothetical protein [Flavobacterium macrobrachii]|jgi:hypothetical protein|uniref:Uncharacterized protein n=1 Tax=Flavobacterium macrobrachii TaxID=591204 RepID=A0ABS2CUZ1_9FLAO|nr:hypothetical protein [Flavobacterium macrobrachii]MBM6498736.1 hypothetical protein [Flavobacterium macrobrachii]
MKKVLFSLIMLVSFSFTSIAREKTGLPCYDAYVLDMEYLTDHGLPENQAEFFANAAWEECMYDTYGWTP